MIFCVNNYEAGYFNGEQGRVLGFENKNEARYISILKDDGKEIELAPYEFKMQDFLRDDDEPVATFSQFPIKLAYAITIHKSQGMSIERLVCDIDDIFESGQLYVALSRAISPQTLRILYTKNIDFKEYFKSALRFDSAVFDFYAFSKFEDLKA